jgi:hypothetical protein
MYASLDSYCQQNPTEMVAKACREGTFGWLAS